MEQFSVWMDETGNEDRKKRGHESKEQLNTVNLDRTQENQTMGVEIL